MFGHEFKMNIRKWRWSLGAFLCFSLIFVVFVTFDEATAADDAVTLKIGIYDNKPKVYLDNGVAAGLFPDILNYIAQRENWRLDYVFGTWDEGLNRLALGEIDVMVDVAVSAERLEKFDFTNETEFNSWGVIYAKKDSKINSFKDLGDKKIAILKSSVYYGGPEGIDTYLDSFGLKADFVDVEKQSDVFDLLSRGDVDAGVVSRVFGLVNQKDYPSIKETGIFFNPTELRFALTKNAPANQYLIEKLDYWVRQIKDSGVYQQILQANGLGGVTVVEKTIPRWVRIAGLIGAAVLFLSWWFIFLLRRAGIIRTRKLEEEVEKKTEAIKKSERQLGEVIDFLPNATFAINNEKKVIVWNKAIERMTGVKAKDMIGKGNFEYTIPFYGVRRHSLTDLVWEKEKELLEKYSEVKREGDSLSAEAFCSALRNGRGAYVFAKVSPLHDQKGNIVGAIESIRDITKEKELDQAKDEFLSLTSHQLRTPLSASRWSLELFLEDKGLAPKYKERLKDIYASNERLLSLVDRLLKITKIESGEWPANKRPIDIVETIKSSVKSFRLAVKKKRQKINVSFGKNVKKANIDEEFFREAVNNILDNAITYGHEKSIIDIRADANDGDYVISIKNFGPVIPKEEREKIFHKFQRGAEAQRIKTSGAGLGLYFAKKVVETNGGRIWFESSTDKGTTFYFTVPVK